MIQPVQIKRSEVIADIRALADLTGCSLTDAVGNAVRAQLAIERVKAAARQSQRLAKSSRILMAMRKLPVTGPDISDSELYDDDGLPK